MSFCDTPLDFSIKKPKLDDGHGQEKSDKKLNSSPPQRKNEPVRSPSSTPPAILSHNHVQLHLQQHLNRNRDDQVEFRNNDGQNQKSPRSPLSIQLPSMPLPMSMNMPMDGHNFPFLNLPLENHHELIYPPAEIHKISPTSTSSVLDGGNLNVVGHGHVSSSKNSRITRPFKAYPKDPLTFNTVGMYGLSLGGGNGQNGQPSNGNGLVSPMGSTETLINQQSNQAYAEFRKQMLRQVQQETIKGQQHQQQQQQLNGGGKNKRINGLLTTTTSPGQHHDTSPASLFMSQFATSLAANFNNGSGGHNDSLLLSSPDLNHNSSSEEGSGSGGGHSSGGSGVQSKNTKRVSTSTTSGKTDQQLKDEAYWERRRKNNEAAKRSRDARRAKEDEIAIRAAFLEQENLKLRFELCALKNETAKLRYMLYNG